MRIFRNIIISAVLIASIILGASVMVIVPVVQHQGQYYMDAPLRTKLSGKLEMLFVGDSDCLSAVVPSVIDETMNTVSYNLAGSMMTTAGMQYLLKKEIGRNPIKTVAIQLSPYTLNRTGTNYGDGDSVTIRRLDSLRESLFYLTHCVESNDWVNVYARCMVESTGFLLEGLLNGGIRKQVVDEYKGFHPKAGNNLTLDPDKALSSLDSKTGTLKLVEKNAEGLSSLIDLCKSHGIRVILFTLPVPDYVLWQYSDRDVFREWAEEYSSSVECEYYDFNLIKERYQVFSDVDSFADSDHMSEKGANVFSHYLGNFLERLAVGQEKESFFYDSYSIMKLDSPYSAMY